MPSDDTTKEPSHMLDLGAFIRQQRERSAISLRKLADVAGISNPYLSQIERGLRKPSAEILKRLARGLSISAESLYTQAGLLEHRDDHPMVVEAIQADQRLEQRHKQLLLDLYRTLLREQEDTNQEAD
jgi:transcriptional regulator with XRE-family HTH domain